MRKNWKTYKLGEIAEIIMGQSPAGETCNENGIGIPLLNGPTEFSSHYPIPVQFTTDAKKISQVEDILFCVRGSTTGRMNWSDRKYAIGRGLAAIRHKEGKEYKYFLKGLIDVNLKNILGITTGSTFPNIGGEQLKKFNVIAPDLRTQSQIASILSSLDNKIELNLQMNQTLEAMAQAIFKEWFVDFKFPRSSMKLVNGLPKGWRKGTIDEICTNARKTFNPKLGKIDTAYVGLEHIPKKCISLGDWGHSSEVASQKSIFEKGDILFGKLRPYFHKVVIAPLDGVSSTDILVIRGKNSFAQIFSLMHLSSDDCIQYANSHSDGTRMPRVRWDSLSKYSIVIPVDDILKEFQQIVTPMIEKMSVNVFENITLTKLRDNLLPKLMTGQFEVA